MRVGLLSLGESLDDPAGEARAAPAARQQAIVAGALAAERLGFDSLWLREPCSGGCATVLLAAIAARTRRLRLGAAVPRLAGLDPLRVAEDYATLDGLSGGRVELLAGSVLATDTSEASDPEAAEGVARLRESLALLRRLWTETNVTWSGRFRPPLSGVTVEPRPVQDPHPPLWVGGGAPVELAAELGLPLLLPGGLAPTAELALLVERYREQAGHAGPVGACFPVHVGATTREARERWRPYYLDHLRFADRGADRDYERLLADGVAWCGSAAEVTERLLAHRERLGLDAVLLAFDLGGLAGPALRESLERFGSDVLPRLRAP